MSRKRNKLKRTLGFWALVIYGVGDILGAGIYALIGKIAGIAGVWCWLAFLVALVVAALTALSYAELGSRLPKSAGESAFTQAAFKKEWLALLIGWLVLCSGVVSMATISRAFAGYAQGVWAEVPSTFLICGFLIVLSLIAYWGMRQSSRVNIICTMIECTGLLIVLFAGFSVMTQGKAIPLNAVPVTEIPWTMVLQAGALAFFAFIGFEDMVNVSEEVHSPAKYMPRAILTAVAIAGSIYILIALIAIRVVPANELAASSAPLLEVVKRGAPMVPVWSFTLIALFAVANTALLNCIMASRLIYGMSEQGLLPKEWGVVHPKRHTPHVAIGIVFVVALLLALSGTLTFLAGTTSVLLLVVFIVVNASLVVIKSRDRKVSGTFQIPYIVPILGVVASIWLIAFSPSETFMRAGVFVLLGLILVGFHIFTRKSKLGRR